MKLQPGKTLTAIECRFSKPVYPGETMQVDMWDEGQGVAFRASVPQRGVVVLDRGFAEFA